MRENRKIEEVLRSNQEFAHKDLVYYLNAMKMVFASFPSGRAVAEMKENDLRSELAHRLENSFEVVFPFMPKMLLKSKCAPTQPAASPSTS